MKSSKNFYGINDGLNFITFNDYATRLQLLALKMFQWHNLPESCNERFLEKILYEYGKAIFFFDENLGYLNLRCTNAGSLNIYNEPISFMAYSPLYSRSINPDECVIIRNNILEYPTYQTIRLFASRLTETERTTDVNLNAQKTPNIILTTEKERLTMLNIYKQWEGNEPFIMGNKNLDLSNFTTLKTDAPYIIDKLDQHKRNLWSECLTFLGINNIDMEKKERLITDETNANNEMIDSMSAVMLSEREKACEEINQKFHLNLSVTLRKDPEEKEVKNNVQVYNGIKGIDRK